MFCENLEKTCKILNTAPHLLRVYEAKEADEFAARLRALNLPIVTKRKREYCPGANKTGRVMVSIEYINAPAAFDIETSSFLDDEQNKVGAMYVWQLAIAGEIMMGRTWEELHTVMDAVTVALGLSEKRRLIIGVHNLAWEFQFMHKQFFWDNVFAIDERKPIYCVTRGYEFRCTYQLSGYALRDLHKSLNHYNVHKATGDLDYNLIRHSTTPLTRRERYYCILDVIVVSAYIDEQINAEGEIYKLPLTKTGRVRRYIREATVSPQNPDFNQKRAAQNYSRFMKSLKMDAEIYDYARDAYYGGHTHANGWKAGKTYFNVASQDFTSSYPATICCELYPVSAPVDITDKIKSIRDLEKASAQNALIIDVGFLGLESSVIQERILSQSKNLYKIGEEYETGKKNHVDLDNGRIAYADAARFVLTDVDLEMVCKFYTWKERRIFKVFAMRKGYLPTAFVKAILELYKKKTELKGVKGKEYEYGLSKEMVNSAYGMMVTAIVRDLINYGNCDQQWNETIGADDRPQQEREEIIERYNNDYARFISYFWGVWVTAYARRNLFTAILELGEDYIYSDTDSVKYLNHEKHADYFERYNKQCAEKMEASMRAHGLPMDYWKPKTIKGVEKPLGFWDREPDMLAFKTLGAKRYLYMTKDHELHLTVAGLSKKIALEYIEETFGKYGAFKAFADGLVIPGEHTGKLTHYYIDEPRRGVVTDYLGNVGEYIAESGIYLEPAEYNLNISPEYVAVDNLLRALMDVKEL